jgi:hypothetical protein
MTLMIELRPGIEAGLAREAAGLGVPLAQYVTRLLEQHVPAAQALTPDQRAALWQEGLHDLPQAPLLDDAAISRDRLYAERG